MTARVNVFFPERLEEIARTALETGKKQEYLAPEGRVLESFKLDVSCKVPDGKGKDAVYTGKVGIAFPDTFDPDKVSGYYLQMAMEAVPQILGRDLNKSKEGFESCEDGSFLYSKYCFASDNEAEFAEFARKLVRTYSIICEEILKDAGFDGKINLNFSKKKDASSGTTSLPAPKSERKNSKVLHPPRIVPFAIYSSSEIERSLSSGEPMHFFLGTPTLYEIDPVRNCAKEVSFGWKLLDSKVNASLSIFPGKCGMYSEEISLSFPDGDCPEIFRNEYEELGYSAVANGNRLILKRDSLFPVDAKGVAKGIADSALKIASTVSNFSVPQEREGLYLALPIADYQPEKHILRGAVADFVQKGKAYGLE